MPKKTQPIAVNKFGDQSDGGITIERLSFDDLPDLGKWEQPERHDRYSFFLIEKGSVKIEVDFEQYLIISPAIIYLNLDQVHRIIGFQNVTVTAWAVTNEALFPEYLQLLEKISPSIPVRLKQETFTLLSESVSICIKLSQRKKDPLHHSLLKSHINALVGLIIATYSEQSEPTNKLTRTECITRDFRDLLSDHFTRLKRPSDYAEMMHLSIPYLNECVKTVTGQPVSYHIQHRVILEAKRLLYHSNLSLKEIAAALGYTDYPYFSRLFTKLEGTSPLNFRRKNRD